MIGTQMVAKGLDFGRVTLVGVLMADQALYSDDFRSYERAFSLLTQVVGRSGRGESRGRAIIQTITPENPVIDLAASQDYKKFYQNEIILRKAMLYPPFADICMIGFVGSRDDETAGAAFSFMQSLKFNTQREYSDVPIRALGPSPASVKKVSGRYRYKIILKCRNNARFREMMARARPGRMHFLSTKGGRSLYETAFEPGDTLVFGSESAGLPEPFYERYRESLVRIPMPGPHARSLNLANAASIALYEAYRQVAGA